MVFKKCFFGLLCVKREGVPGGASATGTRSACRPVTEGEERLEVQVAVRFHFNISLPCTFPCAALEGPVCLHLPLPRAS